MSAGVLRIANCSGFYGDRMSAPLEMVEGGPIDVLTGDYLAELTLMILSKDQQKDAGLGYAKTFPLQLRQVAATCLERGIKIVVNAGGLNPAGCADACRAVYEHLGLEARVAHIEGDDLLPRLSALRASGERFEHLDQGMDLETLDAPILSANAYLGGWGIAKALELGADLVICPRVTDASLVVGPAAWHFGWARDDWHALASAVVAGHVLECGPQATGGNYSFFRRLRDLRRPGFPIAEIAEDGSFTVTKHPGTGGEVSIGGVTAQLLYEIGAPAYENPDVTARFDSIRLRSDGPDRVRVHGVQGEPPPATAKVCLNYAGGFKNSMTFLLTGLDIEEKARLVEDQLWARLGGRESFAETNVSLHRTTGTTETGTEETEASCERSISFLTISVKDRDAKKVGRRFSSAAVEMALASYPGFNITAPPSRELPFGVYWPALVSREVIDQRVVFDGHVTGISHSPLSRGAEVDPPLDGVEVSGVEFSGVESGGAGAWTEMPHRQAPLGRLLGARSGDKGGNANLGVWAESDQVFHWLREYLTTDKLRELILEARELPIDRYLLANLKSVNFVIHGFLGDGVAASLATDAQAKGLGEYLRARVVSIPAPLFDSV